MVKTKNQQEDKVKKVKEVLSNYTDVNIEKITMDSDLVYDLGLTSFDFICLSAAIEEDFGIKLETSDMESLNTVADVYQVIYKMGMKQ